MLLNQYHSDAVQLLEQQLSVSEDVRVAESVSGKCPDQRRSKAQFSEFGSPRQSKQDLPQVGRGRLLGGDISTRKEVKYTLSRLLHLQWTSFHITCLRHMWVAELC